MEVSVVSKKLIKPSVPTPLHLRNMSISLMDNRHASRTVPFIIYYTGNHHPNSVQHDERLKRLEKSLSEILTLYYPLAGRYVKENLLINCNDEGVEYAEALVNGELGQILKGQFEIEELSRFAPEDRQESATSPLVAVQINSFKCGGLAIGLRISHRICDAFTAYSFKNGWANACKAGNINDVTVPNFESGVLFPPLRDTGTAMPKIPPLSSTTSENVTRRFVLDAKTMSKLIKFKAEDIRIPTTVVIALIWRAQINAARRARSGFLRTSLLSVAINLRGKTFRKTTENCCGNIYTMGNARFEGDETEMGLDEFVDIARHAIRSTIARFGTPKEEEEDGFFWKLITRPVIEIAEQIGKGEGDVHRFSSMRNLPFYELDFGWGKPAWVSFAERPYKGVMLVSTKGGDGVEAWVTMDKEEMAYFQNDPDIRKCQRIPERQVNGNGDGIHISPFVLLE